MDQDNQANFVEGENGIALTEQPVSNQTESQPKHKKHESKIIGSILALLLIFLVGFAASQVDYAAISDAIAGNSCTIEGELSSIVDQLQLTKDGLRILKATCPQIQQKEAFNASCANTSVTNGILFGCYSTGDSKIYVYDIQESKLEGIKQSVLAHELLHAIWARTSESDKKALGVDLEKIYEENVDIQKSMSIYSDKKDPSELHSIVGQSIKSEKMSEALRAHYAKYFNDQDSVVGFYEQYYSFFSQTQQRIDELKALIEEKKAIIDEKTSIYNAARADLTTDTNSFNSCARTRGCFHTTEEFEGERNILVQRQQDLTNDYRELTAMNEEVNLLIAEYNSKAASLKDMENSINSRYEPPKEIEAN